MGKEIEKIPLKLSGAQRALVFFNFLFPLKWVFFVIHGSDRNGFTDR